MSEKERWIYEEFILKRWGINQHTFYRIIEDGFPCYDQNNEMFLWEDGIDRGPEKYKMDDVEKYEEGHPHLIESGNLGLDAKEKRELGQLRREKEKWDASLEVAVQIGIFCRDQDKQLLSDEMKSKIWEINKDIPETAIRKILKAIPGKYKSKGGRPKKVK